MMPLTRSEAIFGIRRAVLALVDDEHSVCEVTARLGILCNGFRRHTDEELRDRYAWLAGRASTRAELLANRWQLARQLAAGAELACDVQMVENDTCRGWNEFSNDELARFYRELCGDEVLVVEPVGAENVRA